MDKKIEELEKRIKDLENKLNQSNNMFGRFYALIGSSNSDFLIKTKGLVKIQYGSKFIDLIKNGKINAEYSFIHKGDSVGNKEGIWIINNEEIWIKPKNSDPIGINVNSEYLSYLNEQELTSEQQLQALKNIGFFVDNITNVDTSINRIIYSLEEQSLYIINNGLITPLISQTSESNSNESLESLPIIYDGTYIIINDNLKISPFETIFLQRFVCNTIQSENASNNRGFILNFVNGESLLIVDSLTVRKGLGLSFQIYPEFYFSNVNIIDSVEYIESEEESEEEPSEYKYLIIFQNPSNYKEGDAICIYFNGYNLVNDAEEIPEWVKKEFIISSDSIIISDIYIDPDLFKGKFVFSLKGLGVNKNGEAFYLEELDVEDNSNKIATTEWVIKVLKKHNLI